VASRGGSPVGSHSSLDSVPQFQCGPALKGGPRLFSSSVSSRSLLIHSTFPKSVVPLQGYHSRSLPPFCACKGRRLTTDPGLSKLLSLFGDPPAPSDHYSFFVTQHMSQAWLASRFLSTLESVRPATNEMEAPYAPRLDRQVLVAPTNLHAASRRLARVNHSLLLGDPSTSLSTSGPPHF